MPLSPLPQQTHLQRLVPTKSVVISYMVCILTWRENSQLFGNLVDHCFVSCIDDFTSKTLSGRETGCITRCVQKSMATSTRLSERFQEHNAQLTAQQGQPGR